MRECFVASVCVGVWWGVHVITLSSPLLPIEQGAALEPGMVALTPEMLQGHKARPVRRARAVASPRSLGFGVLRGVARPAPSGG